MQSQNVWETFSCLPLAILSKATSTSDRWCDTYPLEIAFWLRVTGCFAAGVTGDKRKFEFAENPSFFSHGGKSSSQKTLKRLFFYRVCSFKRDPRFTGLSCFWICKSIHFGVSHRSNQKIHTLLVNWKALVFDQLRHVQRSEKAQASKLLTLDVLIVLNA